MWVVNSMCAIVLSLVSNTTKSLDRLRYEARGGGGLSLRLYRNWPKQFVVGLVNVAIANVDYLPSTIFEVVD